MPLRVEQVFDYLCLIPKEKDPELKQAISWINDKAFREGITTYEMVYKILRVKLARNKNFLNEYGIQ